MIRGLLIINVSIGNVRKFGIPKNDRMILPEIIPDDKHLTLSVNSVFIDNSVILLSHKKNAIGFRINRYPVNLSIVSIL